MSLSHVHLWSADKTRVRLPDWEQLFVYGNLVLCVKSHDNVLNKVGLIFFGHSMVGIEYVKRIYQFMREARISYPGSHL